MISYYRQFPFFCVFGLVIGIVMTFHVRPADASEPVSIVVNESVNETSISLRELRAVFTMKKRLWAQGSAISVFVLPEGSDAHKLFCKRILGVFPRQLRAFWYRSVYTGTGAAPVEVESEQELIDRVSETPGAIGYILAERHDEDTKTKTISLTR